MLSAGQELISDTAQGQDANVYFLHEATVSLWIQAEKERDAMAVALVASEGMVGCSHLWSSNDAGWRARVFTPGLASVTSSGQLQAQLSQSPALIMAISRFLWQQTHEIAQLSARMLLGDIRTRLALWLQLMQHKTGLEVLPVTHDALARMLGTRRVSITLLAGELQSEGIITLRRGEIEINDPHGLARIAGLAGLAGLTGLAGL